MQPTWTSLRDNQNGRLNLYSAFEGYESELARELNWFAQTLNTSAIIHQLSEQFFISDLEVTPVWSKSIWQEIEFHTFSSIKEAAKILKSNGKAWCNHSSNSFRRSELIQNEVFKFKEKKVEFLEDLKQFKINNWMLLDEHTLLLSKQTNSKIYKDSIVFKESTFPPSRAYLKLWELFTVHKIVPQKGNRVIDFGSSPGGWTWVLQSLGCEVLSIDKAPLAPDILKLPKVTPIKKDAFTIKPQDIGPVDWFFSDIICYPEKLYEYLKLWITSGLCGNYCLTIKLQGPYSFEVIRKFQKIENSKVFHLHHNKHELTFVKTKG